MIRESSLITMQSVKHFLQKSQGKKKIEILLFAAIFFFISTLIILTLLIVKASDIPTEQTFDYSRQVKRLVDKCRDRYTWRQCYGEEIRKLLKQTDLPIALKTIKVLQDEDIKARDCHIIAHELTRGLVEKDPGKWDAYLGLINPSECNYGYIHGILEARKRYDSTFVINDKTITEFCRTLREKKSISGVDQSCSHIMGHLVLVETDNSIPKGVKICKGIPEILQKECFSGLFMENFTRDNLVTHGLSEYVPWDKKVIFAQEELCRSQSGNAALGCWQETSNLYLQFFPFDSESIFLLCGRGEKDEYRDACYFDSLASLLAIKNPTIQEYQTICSYYDTVQRKYTTCLVMGISALLGASDKNIDRVNILCESTPTSSDKKNCYAIAGYIIKGRIGDERQAFICNYVPKAFQKDCIRGNFNFNTMSAS